MSQSIPSNHTYSFQAWIQWLSLRHQFNQYVTPLHAAIHHNKLDYAHTLLQHADNLNKMDQNGNTALHLTMLYPQNTRLAEALINAGADYNQCNQHGATPLHQAAALGNESMVTMLLNRGASPDITDNQGKTAIDYTTHFKERTAVRHLLKSHSRNTHQHPIVSDVKSSFFGHFSATNTTTSLSLLTSRAV